ncbi:MAG: DMT family transporter [Steroidobacteraceae bacterium]
MSTCVLFIQGGGKGAHAEDKPKPWSPRVWTCLGALAIPLWATWPALSLQTQAIPALECAAICFLVASLVLARMEQSGATTGSRISSWRAWIPALAFGVGESGSGVFFLLSTHHISAAEANLITYLWPAMIVAFGAILGIFRPRPRHIAGIVLGFGAVTVLTWGGTLSLSYKGIGLALLAGISWAIYCVFRLQWKEPAGAILSRGFAIAAILCGALHLLLESSVVPSIAGISAAVLVGIVPGAFANLAWDQGFRRGDSQLLAIMAYATPLCSALILSLLGLEPLTWSLLLGAALVVLAGILSRTET